MILCCGSICLPDVKQLRRCDIKQLSDVILNSSPLCACLWTRRRARCCWRRVCTTSRPNSSAVPQNRPRSPSTVALPPSRSIRPHLRPPTHPPTPPLPSRCTGWAWLLTGGLWPTPWIRVWRISFWLSLGAAAQCSAAAPHRCRRAWWSNWCGTSWRSWL